MNDKRYQIFVSSTYEDLRDERDAVIKSILELGHLPVGMEMFSAADEDQWKAIRRQIDQSDYYVVIVAHRYGSVDPSGVSFTEKEYDYACLKGVPTLGFVIEPKAEWPAHLVDGPPNKERLERFKAKVRSKYIGHWTATEDVCLKISMALVKQFSLNPRVGWIRADNMASPETMNELSRLSKENAELRGRLALSMDAETKAREEHEADEEAVRILGANARRLSFGYHGNADWVEGKDDVSLHEIFDIIGPVMQVELASGSAAHLVATNFGSDSREFRQSWPVPRNIVGELFADLAALDLVEPSPKKHSVKDNQEYWALTKKGLRVLKALRISGLRALADDALRATKTEESERVGPKGQESRD